ncbi:Signal transduction histidine kinase [Variovorax sp. OK605]|jgi:signal transduction histidine kinase|uniref:ATP-binding response regulator n=1 Tax=unclassified Variovorax TaxID=663243 RepID=UPI0008B12989|nr:MULTISPECIES: hybrid sensor histidine kinase/response regulator [unclassified Variovorax]SEJ92078.1 Signal transduction histidine kinase [Variovorax sp. OK202]SFD10387.1 Signal transduction histidine kinase [Variovorax sp. OK212]SFP07014.1 Signal transduction histidine kinase [Variovorax sp. OK605]
MNWNFRVLRSLARLTFAQQLILLALVPATLATLAAIAVLTRQHLGNLTELMRANAQTVALQVATVAQAPLARMDRRALQRTAQSGTYQPNVQQVQIWTEDGEIVANSETMDRARGEGLQVVVPIVSDDGRHNGKVMVEMSLAAVQNARRSVWFNVGLVLAISMIGVGLAGWWAARRISEPIRALGQAVDRLGAGEDASVAIEGTSEVRHLQHGFNQAARALAESHRLLQSRINDATAELARKNAQLEVASQAKTRLLAAASHDLRQPLHALTLFSDGLANGETDPVKLQRIGHIRECVDSLDRLFSELLNLSQLDAGVLQPQWIDFPLDRLFDEISRNFRPVAEQQGLRLVVRKTELWVRCDYVMLSRILNNLVSNSLRHTIEGGVLIGARRRGKGVRIDVVDTGVGIARQHQARVFEEFYQVEPTGRQAARDSRGTRGMGLGLATVQRLAELLNTRVELSSRVNKGTCVRVLVRSAPAALPPSAVSPAVAAIEEEESLAGVRILVIDDERTILEGLTVVLGNWGAQVMPAQTRAEALSLADGWAQPPDVVISDLLLQGGDNGLDVIGALERHPRGIGAGTARLLVTGETKPDRLREVASAGITVLYKPVSPRVLRQAIQAQRAAAALAVGV